MCAAGARTSTMNAVMPLCFSASGYLRHTISPLSETCATDVHTFCPLISHSSPSRTAVVDSDATSDPAPGSLKSWLQIADLLDEASRERRVAGSEILLHRTSALVEKIAHLEQALTSRSAIDQAKGMLMARHRVSAERAFDMLRGRSQTDNRKLHAIAQEMVMGRRRGNSTRLIVGYCRTRRVTALCRAANAV